MGRAPWVEAELVLCNYVRTYLPCHARKQPTHVHGGECFVPLHVHGTNIASLFDRAGVLRSEQAPPPGHMPLPLSGTLS